ncbi:MAG: response regulator, partial [Gemmatimonadetes bacterium]|nr:response regulator [Gemmatimonadota bacterium]
RRLLPAIAAIAVLSALVGAIAGLGAVAMGGAALLGASVTAAFTVVWLRDQVQRPLLSAIDSLRQRIDGDGDIHLVVESRDEVGQLAATVNELISMAFVGEGEVQSILATAADGILTIDTLGLVERSNPAAEQMFGRASSDMLGLHIGLLVPSYEQLPISTLNLGLDDLFADELSPQSGYELEGQHVDSTLFPMSITVGQLPSADETRYVLVVRDIRQQKEAEAALRAAADSAEATSRTKSEFLANMSHEIRTPMNGIIGMTDLALEDADVQDETREYLEAVRTSADSLLEIINDILDFSKIEAGRLELEAIDFDLRTSLDTALLPVRLRAREKGLDLRCHVTDEVPANLSGDPTRLRQVVTNLVSNAIKFTDHGHVSVKVEVESRKDADVVLHGSIEDTGIGIPTEQQPRIFESFTQADGSTTRRFGGTGLGLSICTQIVDLMDGRIWVESEEGRGSTFHFLVHMQFSDPPIEDAVAVGHDHHGRHLLLVSDGRSQGRGIGDELTERGWNVENAAGLEKVLDAVALREDDSDGAKTEEIAAIVLDLVLADCLAVASSLAQRWDSAPPTLILARGGQRGDASDCRRHGVAAYLNEAATRDELHEALVLASGPDAPADLITRYTLRERRRQLRILLAEDNIVNQRLGRELLQRVGHDVEIAEDGERAVEMVQTGSFDLVLMDVSMPQMDGLEATAVIRAAEEEQGSARLPIVAMTAHALTGDRERCLEAGMDDYLPKPLNRQQLYEVVAHWTGTSAPLTPAAVDVASLSTPQAPKKKPVFDRVAALDRMADDEELLQEVIELFLEDMPKQVSLLQQHLDAGNVEEMGRTAHGVKGAAANIGAERVREAALLIEEAGKVGDLSLGVDLVAALRVDLEELAAQLRDGP